MKYTHIAIIGAALTGLYFMHTSSLPRGVRNNNPLNIRESEGDTTQWQGERLLNSDSAFEEFTNPVYGFRAGARILRSYNRQGINTLSGIIARFAPSHENDTDHYVKTISKWTGIPATLPINTSDNVTLASVLHAMSRMEVGNYYTLKTARAGVDIA